MTRRTLLLGIVPMIAYAQAPGMKTTVRGRLVQGGENGPALDVSGGKRVTLDGDADTLAVLGDKRLLPYELEVNGHYSAPGRFTIDPSYTKNLWALKDGKRLMVTYWCDICSIRTYTPGKCMCCQKETELDLRDPSAQ